MGVSLQTWPQYELDPKQPQGKRAEGVEVNIEAVRPTYAPLLIRVQNCVGEPPVKQITRLSHDSRTTASHMTMHVAVSHQSKVATMAPEARRSPRTAHSTEKGSWRKESCSQSP